MEFTLEKISNMVFLTSSCGVIFQAWDSSEFTERKYENAKKKIQKNYKEEIKITRKF